MRSWREGARKVAVSIWDLVDEALSLGSQPHRRVMLVFVQVSSMKTIALIDEPLIGSPSFAVATYVWAILLACDGLFDRDADPAKGAAYHRGIGFDPSLGRKPIAEGLKRDVRFVDPCGISLEARWPPCRLSRAFPFNTLKPFDRHGFADLIPTRCCAAAHLAPLHRINHAVTQVLRIRLRHLLLASGPPTGRIKISLIRGPRSNSGQRHSAQVNGFGILRATNL